MGCPIDFLRKALELSIEWELSVIESNNHKNTPDVALRPEFTNLLLDAPIIPSIMIVDSAIS